MRRHAEAALNSNVPACVRPGAAVQHAEAVVYSPILRAGVRPVQRGGAAGQGSAPNYGAPMAVQMCIGRASACCRLLAQRPCFWNASPAFAHGCLRYALQPAALLPTSRSSHSRCHAAAALCATLLLTAALLLAGRGTRPSIRRSQDAGGCVRHSTRHAGPQLQGKCSIHLAGVALQSAGKQHALLVHVRSPCTLRCPASPRKTGV